MIRHPARAPQAIVAAYPSHIHRNLLPRLQGRGVGTGLLAMWIGSAHEHGVNGIRLGANAGNHTALRFWAGRGFCRLPVPASRTLWFVRSP